jgi:uncharacterized membrane protein YphA (DoxX/SURF4 family)
MIVVVPDTSHMRLTVDDTPSRLERIGAAIPRIVLALVFLSIGSSKFSAGQWIRVFDRIGWGQWFRYAAGATQVAGAILLLIPRTAVVGAALIACTMAGAVYFDLTSLQAGPAAVIPLVLFAIAVGVGLQSYFNGPWFQG